MQSGEGEAGAGEEEKFGGEGRLPEEVEAEEDDEQERTATNVSYQRFLKRHGSAPGKMLREQRRQQARETRKAAAREAAEKKMAEAEEAAREAVARVDMSEEQEAAERAASDAEERSARMRKLITENRSNWREKVQGSMMGVEDIVALEEEAAKIEEEERVAAEERRAREEAEAKERADAEEAAAQQRELDEAEAKLNAAKAKLAQIQGGEAADDAGGAGGGGGGATQDSGLEGEETQAGDVDGPPPGFNRARRMSTDAMVQRDISTLSTDDLLARAQEALAKKRAVAEEDRRAAALANEERLLQQDGRTRMPDDARGPAAADERGMCHTCTSSGCVIS